MFELSTVVTLVAIGIVVVLGFLLVKVLNKTDEPKEESVEVGPSCKPKPIDEVVYKGPTCQPPIDSDPTSGQKLDPVEVKEILDIIKNQPEELVPPKALTTEFNPIITPPPVKNAKATTKPKKTPAKKAKQPAKKKIKKQ